jgi:glycosyltransferase involved in cell wall biosynthesis
MFCQLFPPLVYGGGEVLFWDLAKSLAAQGNQVHVITERVRGEMDRETLDGVSIQRVGRPANYKGALATSFLESLAYFVEAFIAGIQHISRNGTDVIHSNTYVPALAGQICATLLGRKHVITVHDVYLASMPWFWEKWARQRDVGFPARLFGPTLEKSLLRLPANAIHTVSETSRQDLVAIGMKGKIVVVPNGIDAARYEDQSSSMNPRQAIYIGRLVFYKNLELVLRAFTKVIDEIEDAKLAIVGDGPVRSLWENVAAQLGLKKHVKFYGRVSDNDKVRLLKESSFLILPSLVEGFGIVTLEAFACEKPVLVSDIGAMRELVTEGVDGYLLNAFSEEDWTEKMVYLFTHSSDARRLGIEGRRKFDAHYSIKRVARQMESLYASLMSHR